MYNDNFLKALSEDACKYFSVNTSLVASQVFGLKWPQLTLETQRSRMVGHWGANPGIAWIIGHLAA